MDPLLSNLSPTSTLEALEATEVIDPEGQSGQSLLQDSVAAASTSERALGIRAALAGKKLKEWYRELTAWPWPESSRSSRNGFDRPSQGEKRSDRSKPDHEGCLDKALSEQELVDGTEYHDQAEYWGALPAQLVQDYERRVDMIRDDMEALGLEDLKDYVRDAHLSSNPRRLSRAVRGTGVPGTEYVRLDDFTAVITTTIMHALPIISRLNSLLTTWSIRLVILRQIPEFLKLLEHARLNMRAAWNAITDVNAAMAKDDFDIARTALHSKRVALESIIFELGRKLDAMLDILEGREDTVPEDWIDGMENIEAEFGNWVVESEKRVMEEEWKFSQSHGESVARSSNDNHSGIDEAELLANSHQEFHVINTDEKEPPEKSPESTNIYALKSSLSLAAAFGYDGEVNGMNEYATEVATPELGGNTFGMSLSPRNPLIQTFQGKSQLLHQMPDHVSGIKVVESLDADLSHDITAQNEEDKNAVSREVDNRITQSSDPTDMSPSMHEPLRLSSLSNISQTTIINHGGLHVSTDPISTTNMLENSKLRDSCDDLNLNASINPVDAPCEPRISKPLSMPANISSLDLSDFQLRKNTKRKGNTTPRPAPLLIKQSQSNMESTASSDISSDTSVPGSGTSEYFSNMSSPEIQQASMAEYFENPVEVTTPSRGPSTPLDTFSRRSSLLTERGENGAHENGSMPSFHLSLNRRRASSFAPDSSIPESTRFEDDIPIHRQNVRSHVRVRSASLKSFEVIPRREVGNMTYISFRYHY